MPTVTIYASKDAVGQSGPGSALIAFATVTLIPLDYNAGAYGAYTEPNPMFFFDVSSIAGADVNVVSAVFNYYVNASLTDTNVYKGALITAAWNEVNGDATPTWDTGSLTTATLTNNAVVGYQTFSDALLTAWAQGWVDGSIANYGLVFDFQSGTDTTGIDIDSYETTGTANDPYLTIVYGTKLAQTVATHQSGTLV